MFFPATVLLYAFLRVVQANILPPPGPGTAMYVDPCIMSPGFSIAEDIVTFTWKGASCNPYPDNNPPTGTITLLGVNRFGKGDSDIVWKTFATGVNVTNGGSFNYSISPPGIFLLALSWGTDSDGHNGTHSSPPMRIQEVPLALETG